MLTVFFEKFKLKAFIFPSFQLKQVSFDFHDSEQNGIEHFSIPTLIIFQKLI